MGSLWIFILFILLLFFSPFFLFHVNILLVDIIDFFLILGRVTALNLLVPLSYSPTNTYWPKIIAKFLPLTLTPSKTDLLIKSRIKTSRWVTGCFYVVLFVLCIYVIYIFAEYLLRFILGLQWIFDNNSIIISNGIQSSRERIKILKAKINARNERIKLVIQRGTPDIEPLET